MTRWKETDTRKDVERDITEIKRNRDKTYKETEKGRCDIKRKR